MNKLVITTQYLENYGDINDVYMKFKGGYTYVMSNVGDLNENEIATYVARVKPFITTDLVKSNYGSEEYITSVSVEKHSTQVCEDWETLTEFSFSGHKVNFMKVTDNREDGFMRSEILEQTETWTGVPTNSPQKSGRGNYKSEYLMKDGDIVNGQEGLKEWFAGEVA